MIGVRNNGRETFHARYDGKDYKFEHGVVTTLSEDAATHIFGFGLEDKKRVLVRHGWLTHSHAEADAMKRLDDFVFLAAEVKFEEPSKIARNAAVVLADPDKARIEARMEIPEFVTGKK